MPHNALNYTKCAVIVHGKSEFALVKYIYTNLHLPVKIIAKDKGRGSIQINGLSEYLRKKQFRTLMEFANEYSVEYDRKTKGPPLTYRDGVGAAYVQHTVFGVLFRSFAVDRECSCGKPRCWRIYLLPRSEDA